MDLRSPRCWRGQPQAVADPGFSWGAPTSKVGVLTYYFAVFLPKTAWKWKNLDPQGARIIDVTLGSATNNGEGHQPINYLANFYWKLHENKEIGFDRGCPTKEWIKGNLVYFICEAKSMSKQDVLIAIT